MRNHLLLHPGQTGMSVLLLTSVEQTFLSVLQGTENVLRTCSGYMQSGSDSLTLRAKGDGTRCDRRSLTA